MGRLIDEDILINFIPEDLNAFEEEEFCTSDMIHLIEDAPTVDAIPKADYEKRLKADLVDMLKELKEQLREMHEDFFETEHFDEAYGVSDSMDIIQQKINSLKENT